MTSNDNLKLKCRNNGSLSSFHETSRRILCDVSFPLSGNRGYDSNRSVPFRAFTRHQGEFSVMSRSRSQGTEVTTVTGAFPFELSQDITENSL